MINNELGHLDDAPHLGSLTEIEFVRSLADEIMLTIMYFTEDGQPVKMGPFPVQLIKDLAEVTARCTRAYDTAHTQHIRKLNGAAHQNGR